MRDQKVLIFFNLEKVFLAWRNLNPWQFLEDYHSSICARTTTDTLPWQLCPVQRLPTLASWPLFHLVFLCLSSPLSLPMKQRNRDWRIRKKTYTTPKKLVLFWLSELSKSICCRFAFAEPLNWFDERSGTTCPSQSQERKNMFSFSQAGTKTLLFRLFSRAWHWLHDSLRLASIVFFLRLEPIARFPAFSTDFLFPAFATGCTISRVCHR